MKFIVLAILIIACKPNGQKAVDEAIPQESIIDDPVASGTQITASDFAGAKSQESDLQSSVSDSEVGFSEIEAEEIREKAASTADIALDTLEEDETIDSNNAADGTLDTPHIEVTADHSMVNNSPSAIAEEAPEMSEGSAVNQSSTLHGAFNAILNAYVDAAGNVDYKGLKSNQPKLDNYLKALSDNPIQSNWSKDEQLAYWINAYNAFTLKLILDNYPLESIMNLEGGKVWDKKWIELGNKVYSLNQIENDIIRPEFQEPRIHFAVNCAAASCPPLAAKAFTAENLQSLLEERTMSFINNSEYNQISSSGVVVSKIFDWYGSDFGDLISYLNQYSRTSIKKNAAVNFQEYDWSLNSQ